MLGTSGTRRSSLDRSQVVLALTDTMEAPDVVSHIPKSHIHVQVEEFDFRTQRNTHTGSVHILDAVTVCHCRSSPQDIDAWHIDPSICPLRRCSQRDLTLAHSFSSAHEAITGRYMTRVTERIRGASQQLSGPWSGQ